MVGIGFRPPPAVGRSLLALLGAAALTAAMLPFRGHIPLGTATLIYLLFAVAVAAAGGLWPGLIASVAVILALDFVFVPPVLSFTLTQTESADLIGLMAFLLVALTSSVLFARFRGRAGAAMLRQQESELLYELATLVVSDLSAADALAKICTRVRTTFGARRVAVLVRTAEGTRPAATDSETAALDLDVALLHEVEALLDGPTARASVATPSGRVLLPMVFADEVVGVLYVDGATALAHEGSAAERLLQAFAQVAALAVHHGRLMQEATETLALREADTLKSALLAAVSHELRTPLGSIKTAVTGLLDPGEPWLEGERREFLVAIDGSADRLTAFVGNLLELSRLEGGALQQMRDWYAIDEFLRTVVDRLEPALAAHPVTLRIAPDAGDAYFDYVQLGQVVQNLLENAAKFSPPYAPIAIEAARADGAVTIAVTDAGAGIRPDDLPHVFERFYRGRGAELAPGTGLGLTISKGIIDAHGGTLSVEAAPEGIGARFVVSLPVPAEAGVELARSAS